MELKDHELEPLVWDKIRPRVLSVNPELTQIIDHIAPDHNFPFFKVNYPYGSHIVKQGIVHLPNRSGEWIPWNDATIPQLIQNELSYFANNNAAGLLLSKTAEIFFPLSNQPIPLCSLAPTGTFFGARHILDLPNYRDLAFAWNITAGARSLFMLPPVAKSAKHTKLCRALGIDISKPNTLSSQWSIFKTIASVAHDQTRWTTEVLFFGRQWFEHLLDDRFIHFRCYLYRQAWGNSYYFQSPWEPIFSWIRKQQHIQYEPYIINTVEHLLMIGSGIMPGFGPAIDDSSAPITRLQYVYRHFYELEQYEPVIFQLQRFDMNKPNQCSYYSLGYPTVTRFFPRTAKITTKLNDLICIKLAMKKYLTELSKNSYVRNTILATLSQRVYYHYFHNVDNHSGIESCDAILKYDTLLKNLMQNHPIPKNSPFLQGSICLLS